MDLETLLRANLDAKNHAGRPLAEYRLRVETLDNGMIALALHPEGFNSELTVFGIEGSTLVSSAELEIRVAARRDAEESERKAFDELHAANNAKQRAQQEELRAEEERRAAEERAKATPASLAEALPGGDAALTQ